MKNCKLPPTKIVTLKQVQFLWPISWYLVLKFRWLSFLRCNTALIDPRYSWCYGCVLLGVPLRFIRQEIVLASNFRKITKIPKLLPSVTDWVHRIRRFITYHPWLNLNLKVLCGDCKRLHLGKSYSIFSCNWCGCSEFRSRPDRWLRISFVGKTSNVICLISVISPALRQKNSIDLVFKFTKPASLTMDKFIYTKLLTLKKRDIVPTCEVNFPAVINLRVDRH